MQDYGHMTHIYRIQSISPPRIELDWIQFLHNNNQLED